MARRASGRRGRWAGRRRGSAGVRVATWILLGSVGGCGGFLPRQRGGQTPGCGEVNPCIRGIHTRYPSTDGGGGRITEARMSIRQAMLAILEQGPMYGYQLRAEFEQRTGETWPLNIGQVYTTLTRLERDGLVEIVGHGVPTSDQDGRPDRRPGRRISYRATEAGRGEVSEWFATPVPRTQPAARRAGDQARDRGDPARRRRRHDHPAPAQRHHGLAAGLHPAQALGPRRPARGARRPRLEPGPRLARLRRRGRGALARPLRGEAARAPRPSASAVRRDASRRDEHRGGRPDERRPPPRRRHPRPRRGRHRGPRAARGRPSAPTPASSSP